MKVFYEVTQFNKRGRKKQQVKAQSRSFVKAFLQMFYVETSNGLTQNIVDIDGASKTIDSLNDACLYINHPGLDAGDNSGINTTGGFYSTTVSAYQTNVYADDCGIIVGTSNTAVAVADDNLVTPVAHGTAAGQFVYYGSYGLNLTVGASTASFDVEREFRNSSGGTITIQEIGIYCRASNGDNPSSESQVFGFCIMRDVISPTVAVLNGEYLKVRYTIQVSV